MALHRGDALRLGDEKGITRAEWHRADGTGFAIEQDGKLKIVDVPRKDEGQSGKRRTLHTFDSYKAVSQLPTEPDELRRWAYGRTDNVEGAGSTADSEVFNILRGIVAIGVLPPDLLSAAYRAMAQVPGVAVKEVEVNGEPMLAVGQTDDWLNQELLLDKRTYEYGRSHRRRPWRWQWLHVAKQGHRRLGPEIVERTPRRESRSSQDPVSSPAHVTPYAEAGASTLARPSPRATTEPSRSNLALPASADHRRGASTSLASELESNSTGVSAGIRLRHVSRRRCSPAT